MSMARHAARGFTLLEVLLAIVLLALLLAGTYGAVRTATRSAHSGEQMIDRTNRLRVAQEFTRRQISRIMPLAFDRDDAHGTSVIFEGERDLMRFVAPMPGHLSRGGPYVQTLELVGNRRGGRQLIFSEAMLNGFDPEEDLAREPSVLLEGIAEGRFQYRTIGEEGEPSEWLDEWDDPSVTPIMVRIALRMQPEAGIEFPDMEIPLMLDAGAAHNPHRAPRDGLEQQRGRRPMPRPGRGRR